MLTIYLKQYNKIIRNAEPELLDNLGFDDILWIDLLSPSIKEQKAVENFIEESLQTRQQGRKWQPTPVFLPGESQGWGSLVGCRLWGCTESDTTEAT